MPTSPEEQEDLDALHVEMDKKKLNTWNYLTMLVRMTPEELRHSGYKTVEEALRKTVERSAKDINALVNKHLKKWPD